MKLLGDPVAVDQPLSLWQILQASVQWGAREGAAFARPLLKPIGLILLGLYGCLAFTYLLIEWATASFPAALMLNPFWILIPAFLLSLVMILIFCTGFWQYLLYFVSLNRDAALRFSGQPAAFRQSFELIEKDRGWAYSLLLLIYAVINCAPVPILAVGLGAGLGVLAAAGFSGDGLVLNAATMLGAAILLGSIGVAFAWGLAMMYMTFMFQVLAFEPVTLNPFPTLVRSFKLVHGAFWHVFALQVVLMLATVIVIPGLVMTLLSVTRLSVPLDWFHGWLIDLILRGAEPIPGDPLSEAYSPLYGLMVSQRNEMAAEWTGTAVSFLVTAFLLPWGTFAFTLLYRNVLRRRGEDMPALLSGETPEG